VNIEGIVLTVLAWALIGVAFVNVYFVWHGARLFLQVQPRSLVLFALLYIKVTIWLMSVFFAVSAWRFMNGIVPAIPFGGIGLALMALFVGFGPLVINRSMIRFTASEEIRQVARDEGRDEGRDSVRDPARDLARDAEHDIE
jgi:hypothetical protein